MNVVSREESGNFAPFDLTKTPKFNKKKDKVQLAIGTFKIANNYFEAAQILLAFTAISVTKSRKKKKNCASTCWISG